MPRLEPIGWGEVVKLLRDHSRYFSIIREDGKYSFVYSIRYNIRWSLLKLIFQFEEFKRASVNSDYIFDDVPVFFLGVPAVRKSQQQKLEGISFVDFINILGGGGGGLSWSEAPYLDKGFTILPFCRFDFEDGRIHVATQKDMNLPGKLKYLISGFPPPYAYWMLMDGKYYLNTEYYAVELVAGGYVRFLCDAVIIQRKKNRTYCNDTKLEEDVKLINW